MCRATIGGGARWSVGRKNRAERRAHVQARRARGGVAYDAGSELVRVHGGTVEIRFDDEPEDPLAEQRAKRIQSVYDLVNERLVARDGETVVLSVRGERVSVPTRAFEDALFAAVSVPLGPVDPERLFDELLSGLPRKS